MRLSLSQQVQNSLAHISNASLRLVDAQNRLASGKRILRASDDVPGTARALSLRSAISTLGQLSDNTIVSKPLLNVTDNALNEMGLAIASVRGLAMQAASSALTDPARDSIVAQLDGILQELADVANTTYMGRYIFSGTASDTPAVEEQPGPPPYAYMGDSGIRRTQILAGVTIPVNIPGERVFNFDQGAGLDTTDVFTMVTRLRDAISAGSVEDVSAELENIDANADNVLACRAQVGSWMMRVERAQDILADTEFRLRELLSAAEDIDLPQAVIELKTQENIYQAALAVSSRVLDLSLASLRFS